MSILFSLLISTLVSAQSDYQLRVVKSSLCLRSETGQIASGAGLKEGACDSQSLTFQETKMSDGTIQLKIKNTNLCVSVLNNSQSNATRVGMETCSTSDNRRFYSTAQSGNSVSLKAKSSGKCVDVTTAGWLMQYSCWDSAAQKFQRVATQTDPDRQPASEPAPQPHPTPQPQPQPPSASTIQLKSVASNQCIQANGGSVSNGNFLIQGACDSKALSFVENSMNDGSKQYKVNGTSLCLSVLNGDRNQATRVGLSTCSDSSHIKFTVTSQSDGSRKLAAKHTGYCVDITTAGWLMQYTCWDSPAQKFHFVASGGSVTEPPPVANPQPQPQPQPTPQPTPTPNPGTINSVDTIISDMRTPATVFARSNSEASVLFGGNYQQSLKLSPQYAPTMNNITSWCWPFMLRENRASNAAVQVRFHEVYALRASTNQWVRVAGGRPSGWRGNYHAATYELQDEVVINNDIVQVRPGSPPRTDLVSYELWTPDAAKVIDYMKDIKAVFATCQMRLVNVSTGGPVDLSQAKYAGQVGFDLWRRGYGPFQPGVTQFWGPNGKMKSITNDWQSFNVISIRPYDITWSALPPELGMGNWTTPNPYLNPPYVITEDEVRRNPPPLR